MSIVGKLLYIMLQMLGAIILLALLFGSVYIVAALISVSPTHETVCAERWTKDTRYIEVCEDRRIPYPRSET